MQMPCKDIQSPRASACTAHSFHPDIILRNTLTRKFLLLAILCLPLPVLPETQTSQLAGPTATQPTGAVANPAPTDPETATAPPSPSPATKGLLPSDIVLLLDNTASMKNNDPQFMMPRAIADFINLQDTDTQLAIVIFDQSVQLVYPLTTVDDTTRPLMLDALKKIDYKGLYSNSPSGLERAIYELKLHAREATYRSIIFLTGSTVATDGTQNDRQKLDGMHKALAADARENDIRIFGIALADSADFQLIQSLARQTDAKYFHAVTAGDIAPVFNRIAKAIAAQPQQPLLEDVAPVAFQPVQATTPPPAGVAEKPTASSPRTWLLIGIAGLLALAVIIGLLRYKAKGATRPASSSAMPNARLVDTKKVTGTMDYPLTTTISQIGRVTGKTSPDVSYIVLEQPGISRHHAVIEYRHHAFWVMDQGSANGTTLNGTPLDEERCLKHGDILGLDTLELTFFQATMKHAATTAVQPAVFLNDITKAPDSQTAESEDIFDLDFKAVDTPEDSQSIGPEDIFDLGFEEAATPKDADPGKKPPPRT